MVISCVMHRNINYSVASLDLVVKKLNTEACVSSKTIGFDGV